MQSKVEAEWMWGLLHPSLLAGQGGYYLSLLSSSLHLIKVSIFLFLWKQRLMNDSIQLNPPLKNVHIVRLRKIQILVNFIEHYDANKCPL